jgi:pyruvate formate lyase activating enzyme
MQAPGRPHGDEGEALQEVLRKHSRKGSLFRLEENGVVRCHACAHRCRIAEGKTGTCRVRFVEDGELKVPWGYVAGLAADPIEKKPFFHAFPGREALSFGMLGCNLRCRFCQNWFSSQVLRDPDALARFSEITAEEIVSMAVTSGCPVIASTYNEPLITSEWAMEIFRLAKPKGIVGAYVSNGFATKEVLEALQPYVKLYKVDLKSYEDPRYEELGGRLPEVLTTIARLLEMGFWVEVVTLLVPEFNDSESNIRGIADFLVSISPDIPWHITAYHRDYRMDGPARTEADSLVRAVEIGRAAGVRYVYAGNLPGMTGSLENTNCHNCGALLIERTGFRVRRNRMEFGACPDCRTIIPGVWA